jgi:hypothetical protein
MEPEREQQIIEETKASLQSGRSFAMAAASARSVRGYKPPTNREVWGHAVKTIGMMAERSDAFAQVASRIVGKLNLYQSNSELRAQVYEGAAAAIRDGYTDVIGLAGPEPPRRRHATRPFTLSECVLLDYWLEEATYPQAGKVPGVGWAVEAIAAELPGLWMPKLTYKRAVPA